MLDGSLRLRTEDRIAAPVTDQEEIADALLVDSFG